MTTRGCVRCFVTLIHIVMLSACGGGGGGGSGGGIVLSLPGTIQLAATSFDATEGTIVNIAVSRSGGNSGVVSVDYAITPGTAAAGSDFAVVNGALTGTLTYANQVGGNQTISIRIADDDTAEGPESLTLTLSNVTGSSLGLFASATVNIIDNDTAPLSSFGVITELSSATVNGIRYDTNAANVTINARPANASDLKLGHVVALEGDVNFSNGMGTADQITYVATVIGPIEHIDAGLRRLTVLGQTVLTNAATVFDSNIDPDTFAGMVVGEAIQVSGFFNSDGDIIATRIEPDAASPGEQLIGVVTDMDPANTLFSVNGLIVNYGSATAIDLASGIPTDGLQVVVRGALTNGIFLAGEVADIISQRGTPDERVLIGGIVTRFASGTDFDLNGFPVTTNAGTSYVNGMVGDLQINAEIAIDGQVGAGGAAALANEVTFGRRVNDRSTETFNFENFSNISVFGFSVVSIAQGPDFSVEVTADLGFFDDVQVTQNGDTVTIGNRNTLGLNVSVTMPLLNRIDVGPDALANVTLSGFDQVQMSVNVAGVSRVRGERLRIGDLVTTVSGVSLLDFGSIPPIGNANVVVGGVSRATLNMEIGSRVTGAVQTGQGTGNSALFYYGTNTTLAVTTDNVSRVTRLGDTRI